MKALEIVRNSSKKTETYLFDGIESFEVELKDGKEYILTVKFDAVTFVRYALSEYTWYILVT